MHANAVTLSNAASYQQQHRSGNAGNIQIDAGNQL
jgi:hypothetical protein